MSTTIDELVSGFSPRHVERGPRAVPFSATQPPGLPYRRHSRVGVGSATMLAMLVAAFTLALPAWTTASIETTTKTLQRDQDPVIVPTGRLTALRDHDSARYRLYAIGHGRLGPIPFQFDARGADGELLLSEDGAESDFTFGDHDELVFMAKDTGDRASDDTSSDFPRFPSGPE